MFQTTNQQVVLPRNHPFFDGGTASHCAHSGCAGSGAPKELTRATAALPGTWGVQFGYKVLNYPLDGVQDELYRLYIIIQNK